MKNLNDRIKSGLKSVKPKPRWEFVVNDLVKDLILAGLIVLAILLVGAIIYIIRQYNPWENLPKGFDYHLEAILSLPWELILISIALIVLVFIATKKINNLYRISPFYIFVTIVLLISSGYFLAEKMGLNKKMAEVPMAKNIYKKQGKIILVGRGVVVAGQVTSVKVPNLAIIDPRNKTWHIITTPKTHIAAPDGIESYDYITVNGVKIDNDNIEAFMIREMDENWRGFYEDVIKAHTMQCPGCTK